MSSISVKRHSNSGSGQESEGEWSDEDSELETAGDCTSDEESEEVGSGPEASDEAASEDGSGEGSDYDDSKLLSSQADTDDDATAADDVMERCKMLREAAETDTSDEEEVRNTVGNIPLEWYEDLSHLGYDIEGKRIAKSSVAKGDELDEFLSKMDDVDYWRTIKDKVTGQEIVLTDEQVDLIHRLQKSSFPETTLDPYEDYVDHFTHEKQLLPLSLALKPKSSFVPSKWEHRKIAKLVHAIRMGWVKPHPRVRPKPAFYQLWGEGEESKSKHRVHIPAPRMRLPGHAESYNPPPEYLPSQQEKEEWLAQDEEDRATNYLPKRYASLREVPCYPAFIKERFERCLDLYLCPRQRKMRVQVNPDDLIPELPRLSDLQPFPTVQTMVYEGHTGLVECVCVESQGQWLVSGDSDGSVKVWEVATGRCQCTLTFPSKVTALAFNPNMEHSLLAVAMAEDVVLVNSEVGDQLCVRRTVSLLSELPLGGSVGEASSRAALGGVEWRREGERVHIKHSKPVQQVCWHCRGDYLASVSADVAGCDVHIHQLSRATSQNPFKKLNGRVQKVTFHPSKPLFFVATQTYVRVYDLTRQELVKRLLSGVKWISSMVVHPSGDHIILGSYDKKLCWFDLDLSSKPYKILKHHKQAVRSVCCHPHLPLFASSSDDGSVVVCHGKVFNDLLQNPQIVPVKVLRASTRVEGLGAMDVVFHPYQPWLFTAGADSTVRLYCN